MNLVTMGIGLAALTYGVYTTVQRKKAPEKFGKLTAMKKQYGEKGGNAVHVIAYSLIPMGFGLAALALGYFGFTLF
jgi:hypothetical protein